VVFVFPQWRNGEKIRVYYVDGDHNSMLENSEAANIINAILGLIDNTEDTLSKAAVPNILTEPSKQTPAETKEETKST